MQFRREEKGKGEEVWGSSRGAKVEGFGWGGRGLFG